MWSGETEENRRNLNKDNRQSGANAISISIFRITIPLTVFVPINVTFFRKFICFWLKVLGRLNLSSIGTTSRLKTGPAWRCTFTSLCFIIVWWLIWHIDKFIPAIMFQNVGNNVSDNSKFSRSPQILSMRLQVNGTFLKCISHTESDVSLFFPHRSCKLMCREGSENRTLGSLLVCAL